QLDGRPEALVATVARERHVSLKQVDRLPEFAPGGVRYAQVGGGDPLDQAIAERASETQGLLTESGGLGVVARDQILDHHEAGDAPEPALVAEPPGERLRLAKVLPYVRTLAERKERVLGVEAGVNGQFARLPAFGETAERPERLLQVGHGLVVRGPRHRS